MENLIVVDKLYDFYFDIIENLFSFAATFEMKYSFYQNFTFNN